MLTFGQAGAHPSKTQGLRGVLRPYTERANSGRWRAIKIGNETWGQDSSLVWRGADKIGVSRLARFVGELGFQFRQGGAEGVGRSTTAAVVNASLYILLTDFFLTKLFF